MQDYISVINGLFDRDWIREHTLNLYRIERKQTYPAFQKAAEYVYNLLQDEGFAAEKIDVPADGKQVYQDKGTPIGWDVNNMKLTLLSKVPGISDPVISDYQKDPLMAVKHSVSTPEGGIRSYIVTENQMKAGADVRGAFVLLEQSTRPQGKALEMLLDLGAYGYISDFCENPTDAPNHTFWANGCTETQAWHTQAGERDYIGYLITPKTGYYLRQACETGHVAILAESDGRRYESTLPVVSGLLPGESEREIWITAHMYEPLIDDNSIGVIGSIAILKALKNLAEAGKIHLKYSVRVVFAGEMYGMAAAAEYYGGDLSKRTIGGINIDGMPGSVEKGKHNSLSAHKGPDQPGFAGNILFYRVCDDYEKAFPEITIKRFRHYLGDDCLLGDKTIGLPMVWYKRGPYPCFHHNSILDESYLDVEMFAKSIAASGGWVLKMASLTDDEVIELLPEAVALAEERLKAAAKDVVRPGADCKKRMQFLYNRECMRIKNLSLWSNAPEIDEAIQKIKCPEPENTFREEDKKERPHWAALNACSWYEYADNFVFGRVGRGFPHDQLNVPLSERKTLPGYILYGEIADIFSRMDGVKSFKTLIDEVEWDKGVYFTDAEIHKYIFSCIYLTEAGYLTMDAKKVVSGEDITAALKALGVKDGETVLVHSSLSGLGYIPGGADTVIDALKNAVGADGTFLAPAFARPYIAFEGEVNKTYIFRPYDTRPDGALRDKTISTGALPKAMVKRSDICRSGHSTHEWVAMGKNAEEMVSGHGFLDGPTGITSPLHKALKKKGSVIFFGCTLACNTFLHYLEDVETDIPKPGVIKYIDEQGEPHTAIIERQLPGNRDFYYIPESKFYAEAVKRGLKIYGQPCGIGTIYRMELENLYDVTHQMIQEDPYVTVGNNPIKSQKL